MITHSTHAEDWLEDLRGELTILVALSDAICDDISETIGRVDAKMTEAQEHRILVLDQEIRLRLKGLHESLSNYLTAEEQRGSA